MNRSPNLNKGAVTINPGFDEPLFFPTPFTRIEEDQTVEVTTKTIHFMNMYELDELIETAFGITGAVDNHFVNNSITDMEHADFVRICPAVGVAGLNWYAGELDNLFNPAINRFMTSRLVICMDLLCTFGVIPEGVYFIQWHEREPLCRW